MFFTLLQNILIKCYCLILQNREKLIFLGMNIIYKISLIFILLTGCNTNTSEIPNIPVDIYIYPSQPLYFELNAIGGWMYINGGVRGIIVYRKSLNEFIALERNCSFDPFEECATVYVDQSNIFATDSCCQSQFLILDGQVINPPAILPLKQYNTYYDGNMLHIYNF